MNHKYIYSARAREVAAMQEERRSFVNKTLFLLAMLALAFFAADSKASEFFQDHRLAGIESSVVMSGVYLASLHARHYSRKPYNYRYQYRPRSRHHYPRYRSRNYSKHYYRRYGYGNTYRFRRYY